MASRQRTAHWIGFKINSSGRAFTKPNFAYASAPPEYFFFKVTVDKPETTQGRDRGVDGRWPHAGLGHVQARMYSRCVSGTKLRTVMSLIMRWRSGLTGLVVMGSSRS